MKKEYKSSIVRSLIYIFEIILIVGGITYFSLITFPVTGIGIIERFIVILTFYQLLIYSFFKMYDAAKKDSLYTLKNYCKIALLAINKDDGKNNLINHYFEIIKRQIDLITNDSVINTSEVLDNYKRLIIDLENLNTFDIELLILNVEHSINMVDLEFNQSIFLRTILRMPNQSVKDYKKEHDIK